MTARGTRKGNHRRERVCLSTSVARSCRAGLEGKLGDASRTPSYDPPMVRRRAAPPCRVNGGAVQCANELP